MRTEFACILISILFATACATYKTTSSKEYLTRSKPDTVYLIDANQDGNYEAIHLDKADRPIPIQGEKQFTIDFYSTVKYPAIARENGIEGAVILEVELNEDGKVLSVNIKEGISTELDNEAIRAFIHASQNGYYPLIINQQPVKFKMHHSVGFWLG